MRRRVMFALLTLLALVAPATAGDGDALLAAADTTRAVAASGLTVTVHVLDPAEPLDATVRAQGDRLRVDVTAPSARAGEVLLFVDGKAWFWRPGLRRPLAVSPGQAFGGRASNADLVLLLAGLSEEYEATLGGTETLGAERATVLNLQASAASAPWPKLRVWLGGDPARVLQAAVLDGRGEVSRTVQVRWGQTVAWQGGKLPFPDELVITERGSSTTVRYDAPVTGALQAELFAPERLGSP